jgi:hypothetical protein
MMRVFKSTKVLVENPRFLVFSHCLEMSARKQGKLKGCFALKICCSVVDSNLLSGKRRLNFANFITKERLNFPAVNRYRLNITTLGDFMT